MEGEEYYVYNPDILHDKYWTINKLKQLCNKLKLINERNQENEENQENKEDKEGNQEDNQKNQGNIKRNNKEKLKNLLIKWNKKRYYNNFIDYYPMNVKGNNFSLLKINIKEKNIKNITNKQKKKKRNSNQNIEQQVEEEQVEENNEIEEENNEDDEENQKKRMKLNIEEVDVDPSFLRPIKMNNNENQNQNSYLNCITPTKGILKKSTQSELSLTDNESENSDNTSHKSNKLQFSPFNRVKIISHRFTAYAASKSNSSSTSSYPSL